jgi:hypothetical protein
MSQSNKVLKEFGAVSAPGSVQNIKGSGALPLDTKSAVTTITTTGAATGTLANGVSGQIKHIVMVVDGGDYVLTPANYANGTTITFDTVADSITLVFVAGEWYNVGTPTATVA